MVPDPEPDAGAILSQDVVAFDGKMAAVQFELPPLKLTVSGAVAEPELDGVESATVLRSVDKLASDAGAAAYDDVKTAREVVPLSDVASSS
jgi:hypothetical protein